MQRAAMDLQHWPARSGWGAVRAQPGICTGVGGECVGWELSGLGEWGEKLRAGWGEGSVGGLILPPVLSPSPSPLLDASPVIPLNRAR